MPIERRYLLCSSMSVWNLQSVQVSIINPNLDKVHPPVSSFWWLPAASGHFSSHVLSSHLKIWIRKGEWKLWKSKNFFYCEKKSQCLFEVPFACLEDLICRRWDGDSFVNQIFAKQNTKTTEGANGPIVLFISSDCIYSRGQFLQLILWKADLCSGISAFTYTM